MDSVTSRTRSTPDSAAPRVSVILPCRNVAGTVEQALRSIAQQTQENFECLCWDDGSEDETGVILKTFAGEDERFRVVGDMRVGLIPALQALAAEARGEYLARMDADDMSHPERFAAQIALCEATPNIGLCGCLHQTIGDEIGTGRTRYDNWMNSLTGHDAIAREAFVECPVAHPTFFTPRAVFEAVGGYAEHPWPEDYDLVMRVLLSGRLVVKVPEVLFNWREHPARTSLNDSRYSEEQFRALKRHYLTQFFPQSRETLYQWGAGDVGKRWLREWEEELQPVAVVDIDPRKIDQTIHGVPVITPESLPSSGSCFVVVAVGAPGARKKIRRWFDAHGYTESKDFVFVA